MRILRTGAILLILLSLPRIAPARETLSVDRNTVIQENFLGVNAVYHGFMYLPEATEMGMTPELRALELARVKESGIRIARTFYRPDWAMGDGPWLKADWESRQMKALYAWLADMQRLGIDVALNMGWWFPRDVIWNRDQHLPSYPDDLKNYCQWLSESIHQIVQRRGFSNVKYIVMFTEPSDGYGDTARGKEVWAYYKEVVLAANQRLIDDKRRHLVKLVGPNTSQAPLWLDKVAQELNGAIDIYASHNYNFTSYQDWLAMAQKIQAAVASTGKPFWVDEYGVQDFALRKSGRYGTVLALANAAFLNAGAQSTFLWILNDQYYPAPLKHLTNGDSFLDGKHSWGLFPWLAESHAPRPSWEAFVLLSRFLGQAGSKVLKTEGGAELPIAAVEQPGGELNLLVVNGRQESREVAIEVSRAEDRPMYRYAFDPQDGAQPGAGRAAAVPWQGAGRRLEDRLAAGEVVIYSTHDSKEARQRPALLPAGGALDNIAFQKEVVTTSADPEWPAANLTDGKRLTTWRSRDGKQGQPEQVTVDLGQPFQARQVALYPGHTDDGAADVLRPEALSVSVSKDKKQWRQAPVKGNTAKAPAFLVASFGPQAVRYVRVEMKKMKQSSTGSSYQARLGEIKVFGQGEQ